MKTKFKEGQVVLYQNGTTFELGIVKEVIYDYSRYIWQGIHLYDVSGFEYNEEKELLSIYDSDTGGIIVELDMVDGPDLATYTDEEINEYLLDTFEEYTAKDYFKYRVWYHTGDTSALTNEVNLHELKNAYAFLIMRRKADTSSIDETPARQLASFIIDETSQLTELEGEAYYECEDALTELINEFKI